MATFVWAVAPGASMSCKPNIESAKYGDGYEQRVAVGINSQAQKWTVKITKNVDAALSFLEACNGDDAFNWTNPRGVSGVYLCREWELEHVGLDMYELSCTFEQTFEVVAP